MTKTIDKKILSCILSTDVVGLNSSLKTKQPHKTLTKEALCAIKPRRGATLSVVHRLERVAQDGAGIAASKG